MELSEVIQKRYSVRGYKPDPVEEEKLLAVLEAARQAPTAGNRQRFQLIVIHTKGREEELGRIYGAEWFVQAPIVICACRYPMDPERKRKDYTDVDIGIVVDHLILKAAELGLGTCWIGAFDPRSRARCWACPTRSSRWSLHRWATPMPHPGARIVNRCPNWSATSIGEENNGKSPTRSRYGKI